MTGTTVIARSPILEWRRSNDRKDIMNADELRALQAPLKNRYREDPSAGVVTLRARGRIDRERLTCTTEIENAQAPAGLHPATGGDGHSACSGDMLLASLC